MIKIFKKYWKLIFITITLLVSIAGILEYIKQPIDGYNVKDVRSLKQGDAMVKVNIPDFLSTELKGQKIFNQNCVQCHGENAIGVFGKGPPLIHKIYEPGHHGDQAFYRAVKLGAQSHHWQFGDMPAINNVTQADVSFIIDYIRAIQKENGIF